MLVGSHNLQEIICGRLRRKGTAPVGLLRSPNLRTHSLRPHGSSGTPSVRDIRMGMDGISLLFVELRKRNGRTVGVVDEWRWL